MSRQIREFESFCTELVNAGHTWVVKAVCENVLHMANAKLHVEDIVFRRARMTIVGILARVAPDRQAMMRLPEVLRVIGSAVESSERVYNASRVLEPSARSCLAGLEKSPSRKMKKRDTVSVSPTQVRDLVTSIRTRGPAPQKTLN